MPYSCTSPMSTSEEDWINEVILFSPLDLTATNDAQSSLSLPTFGPTTSHGAEPEYEDLFSNVSSRNSTATTPETAQETKATNNFLLDNVSVKLQRLKEQNCLTPKALESVFNTQDVLADSGDWQTDSSKHKPRRLRASGSACSGNHDHTYCTKTCRHKASHGPGLRKRKTSRAKAPKPAHPHAPLFQHTSPHMLRRTSVASVNTHMPEPISMANSGYETPCFLEAWYATPYIPELAQEAPRTEAPKNNGFDPILSLFDHNSNLPPISDETASFSESPNPLFASAGPVLPPAPPLDLAAKNSGRYDSVAVQEALAYIDFLQEENMLQQASSESAI